MGRQLGNRLLPALGGHVVIAPLAFLKMHDDVPKTGAGHWACIAGSGGRARFAPDGGQLALFALAALKRGPLSFRVRQIAAYIGYVLIILLMILAFKNDIERNWDRFVDWVSEDS